MAKQICPVCNETKMGFLNSEKIKDGKICENCEKKIGIEFSKQANIYILENLTISRVKEMIVNGETFNYEDEKTKRQQTKVKQREQTQFEKEENQHIKLEKKQQSDFEKNERQKHAQFEKDELKRKKEDSVRQSENQKQQDKNDKEKRLQEIQEQMKEAGVSDLFGTRKEVKSLPDILDNDEHIVYATSGLVGTGTMLIVVSDKRLLFIDRGMLYGTNFREIPFVKINAVNYSTRLMFADISIENGVNVTTIADVSKKTAPMFVDKLKSAISNFESSKTQKVEIHQQLSNSSLADELTKLSKLMDDGILTEDEFNQQKAKLLNN